MAVHHRHGTLQRIERDDPSLTGVRIFVSDDDEVDFARIGEAIGANTHLKSLEMDMFSDDRLPHPSFFEGLKRNTSIHKLAINRCDFCHAAGYAQVLDAFAEKGRILNEISVARCDRVNGGIRALVSTIRGCINLKKVDVIFSRLGDNLLQLEEFVSAVGMIPHLEEVDLGYNGIGRDGCRLLSALLREPSSNLRSLSLHHNSIDDDGAANLSSALVGNTKLERLNLEKNRGVTAQGLNSFAQVMCDASSIDATYSSNHILKSLGIPTRAMPINLFTNITLNHGANKREVAMKKILWKHRHLDMEPFFEWDMKFLPVAIKWFDRIGAIARNSEERVLSVIYQFVRAMPEALEPEAPEQNILGAATGRGKAKRKRLDAGTL